MSTFDLAVTWHRASLTRSTALCIFPWLDEIMARRQGNWSFRSISLVFAGRLLLYPVTLANKRKSCQTERNLERHANRMVAGTANGRLELRHSQERSSDTFGIFGNRGAKLLPSGSRSQRTSDDKQKEQTRGAGKKRKVRSIRSQQHFHKKKARQKFVAFLPVHAHHCFSCLRQRSLAVNRVTLKGTSFTASCQAILSIHSLCLPTSLLTVFVSSFPRHYCLLVLQDTKIPRWHRHSKNCLLLHPSRLVQ